MKSGDIRLLRPNIVGKDDAIGRAWIAGRHRLFERCWKPVSSVLTVATGTSSFVTIALVVIEDNPDKAEEF